MRTIEEDKGLGMHDLGSKWLTVDNDPDFALLMGMDIEEVCEAIQLVLPVHPCIVKLTHWLNPITDEEDEEVVLKDKFNLDLNRHISYICTVEVVGMGDSTFLNPDGWWKTLGSTRGFSLKSSAAAYYCSLRDMIYGTRK